MDEATYTVGALASSSGLTVRTLHHWDAIGLLVPAERGGNGYRRYGAGEVARLYRILALRRLGLSLEAIASVLQREGPELEAAVRAHLARVEEQLATTTALRNRLVRILDALGDDAGPSPEQLIETIEVMTMHEQYYTPEQLEQLAARREALGEEGMRKAQDDWAELIAAVEAERERGTDPADPRVQALVDRWQALIQAFTGGDPGITASLKRMYEEQGAEQASRGAMPAGLQEYVGRAMEARGT
ncbi:MAG TPA: MerR family transcriptional regulator [Solirubrobacter sp.]|nr:MerR family transcriptional regulator [Solirubrobacter sp.]